MSASSTVAGNDRLCIRVDEDLHAAFLTKLLQVAPPAAVSLQSRRTGSSSPPPPPLTAPLSAERTVSQFHAPEPEGDCLPTSSPWISCDSDAPALQGETVEDELDQLFAASQQCSLLESIQTSMTAPGGGAKRRRSVSLRSSRAGIRTEDEDGRKRITFSQTPAAVRRGRREGQQDCVPAARTPLIENSTALTKKGRSRTRCHSLPWEVEHTINSASQTILLYFCTKSSSDNNGEVQHPQLYVFWTPDQLRALLPRSSASQLPWNPLSTRSASCAKTDAYEAALFAGPPSLVVSYMDAVVTAAAAQFALDFEKSSAPLPPMTVHVCVAPGVLSTEASTMATTNATVRETSLLSSTLTAWATHRRLLAPQNTEATLPAVRLGTVASAPNRIAAAKVVCGLAATMAKRQQEAYRCHPKDLSVAAPPRRTATPACAEEDHWLRRTFEDVRPLTVRQKAAVSDFHALYASMLSEITSFSHRRVAGVMAAYPSLCQLLRDLHQAQAAGNGADGRDDLQRPFAAVREYGNAAEEGASSTRVQTIWRTELMEALRTPYQPLSADPLGQDSSTEDSLASSQ